VNTISNSYPIAAIDIGTTSTKGLLVKPNGDIIVSDQKFYETLFPGVGFAEQNPEIIFQSVLHVLKTITSGQKLSGICFSAAMHSLMAVDHSCKALTNLIIWSDTRSINQSEDLISKKIAQELYATTGTPVHPMSPLCKLLWMKENQPEIYKSAFKFISIKEYVLFRLTGEFLVDHSVASATGLFDLDRKQWSALSLELLGLTEEKFSRIVPVLTATKLKKEIATELGLNDVPIIIGASDGCLAQLGSYAMCEDDLSITIGTSGAVRVASKKRRVDPDGRIFNYILDDDTFVCGGATNNGTALFNWYSKNIDQSADQDLAAFVNQIMGIPPGSDGLIMLPYLLGERAPIYNAKARGVFFGVSIDHNRKHFQRAMIEGICFEICWISEYLEELVGPHKNILVSGGFTRSDNWIQILCDVLGKPLTIQGSQDASSIGAAMMGFKALGISFGFTTQSSRTFHPNPEANRIYSESYQKFKKLYTAVEKLF
jgi:gluconokinase